MYSHRWYITPAALSPGPKTLYLIFFFFFKMHKFLRSLADFLSALANLCSYYTLFLLRTREFWLWLTALIFSADFCIICSCSCKVQPGDAIELEEISDNLSKVPLVGKRNQGFIQKWLVWRWNHVLQLQTWRIPHFLQCFDD